MLSRGFLMSRKNRLFCKVMLLTGMMTLATMNTDPAEAYQHVKLQQRQLIVDFEMDGFYEPFFVKGVGYAPVPIGKFMGYGDGWSAVCQYAGPFPLQYPALRFEPGSVSPDSVFTCGANGENFYDNTQVLNRDFPLIRDMQANTVRTWGNVTHAFMQKANEYGLKVIAGYWVDHNVDYTFSSPDGPQQRQALIDGFVNYVNTFKNDPALLMWGLSNENNLDFCNPCVHGLICDRAAQAAGYYQLMNDMALAAKQAEGASFHPVMIVSAELTADLINFASYISDVDIIGINSYRGSSFAGFPIGKSNLFDEFALNFPEKSMIVTEFGADAWNSGSDPAYPENGIEDQISQAIYISSAWDEIVQNATVTGGPVNGGVVFHYSDSWNGYSQRPANADPDDSCVWVSSDWTPSVMTHDHNYTDPDVFGIGVMPDNKVNPEWWGIMSVEKNWLGAVCDAPSQVDCVYPREAYYALNQQFALALNPAPDLVMTSVGVSASSVTQGDNVTFTGTVKNQGGMDIQTDFCVYFYLSTDTTIDSQTDNRVAWDCYLKLAAGASHDMAEVMSIPFDLPAGTYYVGAIADSLGRVDEGNETNNTLVGNVVSLAVGADLAMVAPLKGMSMAFAGSGISLQGTVVNSGTVTTPCLVNYYLSSDANITTEDINLGYTFCGDGYGKLAPGASWTSTFARTPN